MEGMTVALAILLLSWGLQGADGYTYNGCAAYLFRAMDPIVSPGSNSTAHLHTFFGSNSLNPNTNTSESLFGGCTSCRNSRDKSTYWTPTVFHVSRNGTYTPLIPLFRAYYDAITNGTEPIPPNFKMVAGNSHALNASDSGTVSSQVNWYCTAGNSTKTGQIKLQGEFPTINCPGLLAINIFFPKCYILQNGTFVVKYPYFGQCPQGYTRIPQVWFSMRYNVSGFEWGDDGTAPLYLSSGQSYTFHADFFNGWDEADSDDMVTHHDSDGAFFIGGSANQPNSPPCNVSNPFAQSINYKQYIVGHHVWDTSSSVKKR